MGPRAPSASSREIRWPDFFIAGVVKAGTTSLAEYLGQHPEIFMSPVKEPHFFSRVQPAPHLRFVYRHIADRGEYLKLFVKAHKDQLVGEASTSYFWDRKAPRRIRAVVPKARFVVVLRDPVTRAHSHYLNLVREGVEKRTFLESLQDELARPDSPKAWGVDRLYVDCGFYAERLQRLFDLFGERQVEILVFEEFIDDPVAAVKSVFSFLGVDARRAEDIQTAVHNPYTRPRNRLVAQLLGSALSRRIGRILLSRKGRRWARGLLLLRDEKPPLDESSRDLLVEVFERDVRACETLLGRRLPWLVDKQQAITPLVDAPRLGDP